MLKKLRSTKVNFNSIEWIDQKNEMNNRIAEARNAAEQSTKRNIEVITIDDDDDEDVDDPSQKKAKTSDVLVVQSNSLQTRTALNFERVSDPDYKKPVNSAGKLFNEEYIIRDMHRKKLLRALERAHVPQGAYNPAATAQRIESIIFNVFKECNRKYKNHMTERAAMLHDVENPDLRLNVLMGRIKPQQFAFMSVEDMEPDDMEALRIKIKERERRERERRSAGQR